MSSLSTQALRQEHERIQRRTRRGILWSFVAHLVVIVILAMRQHLAPEPMALTEITWLDPVQTPSPPVAPPQASPKQPEKPEPQPATTPSTETVHFKRAEVESPSKPDPQDARVAQDRLRERLATLRTTTPVLTQTVASASTPKLATPVSPTHTAQPEAVDLKRGQAPKPKPLSLVRQTTTPAPRLEVAAAPTPPMEMTRPTEDTSPPVREIAGARLMGPVADRDLVSYQAPEYPATAMRQALEGSVTLRFIVRPNGTIKENIVVERTSGHTEFDVNSVAALRQWRFEELPRGSTGEQWGTITFQFELSTTRSG